MNWTLICILASFTTNGGPWQSFGFQITSRQQHSRDRQIHQGHTSTRIHQQLNNQDQSHSNNSQTATTKKRYYSLSSSFETALCIVPPDEAWDTLQRARHFAHDQSYHQWPPAIRLFYPFCPRSKLANVALDLSTIVEKYDIEPFRIKLDQWTVMPLPSHLHNIMMEEEVDEADSDSPPIAMTPEEEEIQELIANEERKGKERKRQRELRKLRRKKEKEGATVAETQYAIQDLMKRQKEEEEGKLEEVEKEQPASPNDEFNGPAMIALEPDEKSSLKLLHVRELLRLAMNQEVDPAAATPESPMKQPQQQHDEDYDDEDDEWDNLLDETSDFRPLIPMGAFRTIDAALAMARKLKGLWEPLSFDCTELHFVSQTPASRQQLANEAELYTHSQNNNQFVQSRPADANYKPRFSKNSQGPFGCDAIVMLMGEELEQDEITNDLLAQRICEEGTPGGYERLHQNNSIASLPSVLPEGEEQSLEQKESEDRSWFFDNFERKLDAEEGDWEDLVQWLDADEDEEELEIGTTVVIGRTHMFSGESRRYDGMPASSLIEQEHGGFGNTGGTSWGLSTSGSLLWKDVGAGQG